MNARGERLSHHDPERLSDGEWRAVMDYRMGQLELKVAGILRALWANAAAIAVGIIVYLVTKNLGGAP